MLVTVPKIIREKLGEEGAEGLIELLNSSSENTQGSVITLAEEKFERGLAEEIGKLRSEFYQELSKLRSELYQEISNLRSELYQEISNLRSELFEKLQQNHTSTIRWMFLFWVGQIGAMVGILFAFFK